MKNKTTITQKRRSVQDAMCYVGPAFAIRQAGHQFIVIAADDKSLRFAWSMLGPGAPLDEEACKKLAAFEYKATK